MCVLRHLNMPRAGGAKQHLSRHIARSRSEPVGPWERYRILTLKCRVGPQLPALSRARTWKYHVPLDLFV